MHLGVAPVLNSNAGGVYQYSSTMLDFIEVWQRDKVKHQVTVFANEMSTALLTRQNIVNWSVRPLVPTSLKWKTLGVLRRTMGESAYEKIRKRVRSEDKKVESNPDVVLFRREMNDWFKRWSIDLMIYPAPNNLSFETKIPYVMAIHDLQHRLQPEFPEVSANGEWALREYQFRNGARFATLLLADSEVGKEDILNCYGPYGVTEDRVKVLPFLPASYLRKELSERERLQVRTRYHLPERYFFYPAQFWPHKNHARIIQALGLLKKNHNIKAPIVLSGSHDGELRQDTHQQVMRLANELKVQDQIQYLGYVPDEAMTCLYAEAVALVMPTFFGPTNIPVLEAWSLGCPVLTSDIRGIREQAGDAAILVEPRSVESIADGLYRLWSNDQLRHELASRGSERLEQYKIEDYQSRLKSILIEAESRIHEKQVVTPTS